MGYWRVWTAQRLITYYLLLPFLLFPLFTDLQLPFSHVYYISPLLYSDSESGSGNTQSSSCRSSQLRAHAPSILHPVLHPMPSYNSLHHSLHLSCIYHPRCHVMTCLLFIMICICALFSLFIPLQVKPYNSKKTQSKSQANADWNRLLPYSAP